MPEKKDIDQENEALFIDENIDKSTQLYFEEIERYPLLTREEEKELFLQYNEEKDETKKKKIKDKIVKANLRLVKEIAKKYKSPGLSILDFMQEGTIGLMDAVDKFDVSLGYKFSTFAYARIKKKMSNAVMKEKYGISEENYYKIKNAKEKLLKENEEEPTVKEIAEELGVSIEKAGELLVAYGGTVSLDETIDSEGETSRIDLIADAEHKDADAMSYDEVFKILDRAVSSGKLTKKQAEYLKLYFKNSGDQTAMAKQLGVSNAAVSKGLERAMLAAREIKELRDYYLSLMN